MEPVELRVHRSGRAALNKITKTVITIRDYPRDGISPHALLQQKTIEYDISPSRFLTIQRNLGLYG
jgi:hypothetical protein